MWPGANVVGAALKFRKRNEILPSCVLGKGRLYGTSHVAYIAPLRKGAKPETSNMADNRKQGFPKCSTLFLSEDGSPMLFYMTPSAMKTKLRPLIHVRDS